MALVEAGYLGREITTFLNRRSDSLARCCHSRTNDLDNLGPSDGVVSQNDKIHIFKVYRSRHELSFTFYNLMLEILCVRFVDLMDFVPRDLNLIALR